MTDEHQPRERKVRMNDTDIRYLKNARDDIDPSLALGAVARLGAKQLLKDDDSDDAEVRL